MKKIMILILAALSGNVLADGFICNDTYNENMKVKIFNYTTASEGTRKAAIMILSDDAVEYGRKTIASFSDAKGTLISENMTYTAKVDLRVKESNRAGENVFGTKLGLIDKIKIAVDFSYSEPLKNGEELGAILEIIKRNGESEDFILVCRRYLKN